MEDLDNFDTKLFSGLTHDGVQFFLGFFVVQFRKESVIEIQQNLLVINELQITNT